MSEIKKYINALLERLRRVGRVRLGAYAALAALLVGLGLASYAYRNRNHVIYEQAKEPPVAVMAAHTPDPIGALFTVPEPTPEPTPEPLRFCWPLEGEIIGPYAPEALIWSSTMDQWQTHPALDIAAAAGEAVLACAEGVVSDAWQDPLWGNVIEIEHAEGYVSRYANLNTLNLVSPGDAVQAGQVISAVGRSASCESEMPWHLHFALQKNGEDVDFVALMKDFGKK